MFWSLCYLVLRRVLQLAALRFRSEEFKELEIVVLRHEITVLDTTLDIPRGVQKLCQAVRFDGFSAGSSK